VPRPFEYGCDLEQVGANRRNAVVQQCFAAADERVGMLCVLGRAPQPLGQHAALAGADDACAVARRAALARALEDPAAALGGRVCRRLDGSLFALWVCVCWVAMWLSLLLAARPW
jgi:hypothetical protein